MEYTIERISDTGWEPDQYGNYVFNVTFQGETEQHLWRMQPENEPAVGTTVRGHIQPSKSGNATWFKKENTYGQSNGHSAPRTNVAPATQDSPAQRPKLTLRDISQWYGQVMAHADQTCWAQVERDPSPEALQSTAATIAILAKDCGCWPVPSSPEQANGPKYAEVKAHIECLTEADPGAKVSLSNRIDALVVKSELTDADAGELKVLLGKVKDTPPQEGDIPF